MMYSILIIAGLDTGQKEERTPVHCKSLHGTTVYCITSIEPRTSVHSDGFHYHASAASCPCPCKQPLLGGNAQIVWRVSSDNNGCLDSRIWYCTVFLAALEFEVNITLTWSFCALMIDCLQLWYCWCDSLNRACMNQLTCRWPLPKLDSSLWSAVLFCVLQNQQRLDSKWKDDVLPFAWVRQVGASKQVRLWNKGSLSQRHTITMTDSMTYLYSRFLNR